MSSGATVSSASLLFGTMLDRLVRQDHPMLVAEGIEGTGRAAPALVPQATALRLAVDRHALRARLRRGGRDGRGEVGAEGARQGVPVQLADQALHGRLAGGAALGKPSRASRSGGRRAPHSAMARADWCAARMAAAARVGIAGRV